MRYNWKYIKTPKGKVTFAFCMGDKMLKEFDDIAQASHYEKGFYMENSLDKYFKYAKQKAEAKWSKSQYEESIEFIPAGLFRSLQTKIKKDEEEKKRRTRK